MNLGCRGCTRPFASCNCPASVQRAEPLVPLRDAEATIRSSSAEYRMRLLRKVLADGSNYEIVTFDDAADAPAGFAELAPAW